MKIKHYIDVARVDHWFKNVFMIPGILAALIVEPETRMWSNAVFVLTGVIATCIVSSSSYVLNELLDASTDKHHPLKCGRPLASGKLSPRGALVEWIVLAVFGLVIAYTVSVQFFLSALSLWIMGIVYNVPPLRSKEKPYVDVLTESVNNPIRMLLGWYCIGAVGFPPSSLLFAYWMVGAFLMAAKRMAEYRLFEDPDRAGKYRSSFSYYNEERLATSMLVYATGFMFFVAVLVTKYHIELVLSCPFLMAYLAYYTKLTYQKESIVQTPEKLMSHGGFVFYTVFLVALLSVLAVVDIPELSHWLGVAGKGW